MSDSDIPDRIGPAVRWVIAGIALFVFFLIAVEKFNEENYKLGAINFTLFIVTFVVAVKWHKILVILLDPVRRRKLLIWILIVCGAALLAWGIILLAKQSSIASQEELNELKGQLQAERDSRVILDGQLATTRAELQRRLEASPQAQPRPAAKGEFTKKTIRQLKEFYEGRTALQADAFMADEKGKLIDTEGTITRVDHGMVMLQNGSDPIECRFGPEWNLKLSTFRNGETMKVRGTINPVQNGAQIYLMDCEIRD